MSIVYMILVGNVKDNNLLYAKIRLGDINFLNSELFHVFKIQCKNYDDAIVTRNLVKQHIETISDKCSSDCEFTIDNDNNINIYAIIKSLFHTINELKK